VAARVVVAVGALGASLAMLVPFAPHAYASVGSAPYTIGTPSNAVSDVTASPATIVEGAPTNFEVNFMATATLNGSSTADIVITSSADLVGLPADVSLVDDTHTACFQGGTNGGAVSTTSITVQLLSSCTVEAGDVVEVDFRAGSPGSTGSFDFTVTTSANTTPGTSNGISVSATPPTLSATVAALGANASYTVTDASWTSTTVPGGFSTLVLTAQAYFGSTIAWYGGASGYSVTYTPSNGSPTSDEVVTASVSTTANVNDTVTLTLATALVAGDQVNIVGKGTNPSVAGSDVISVVPEAVVGTSLSVVGEAETSSDTILFGTSVTGVTVVASPPVGGVTATYTVGFRATTALAGGPSADICLDEAGGPTVFSTESGVLVTDTTAGWHFLAAGVSFPTGAPATNPGCGATDNGVVVSLPAGYDIRAADALTLTLVDVTNPPTGSVYDFTVATSSDPVPADAASYVIGASGSLGVVVTVDPTSPGSIASYTIANLVATADLAGGTGTINIDGPPGTVFPDAPGYYTIEDSSTPSASGTATAPVTGGGSNDVAITVPATIAEGDHFNLTIEDVINPSSAGNTYTLTLFGDVRGPSALAPFPQANVAYPNGAIVGFAGTDYVLAGGHAFGVASASDLAALRRVDRAQPLSAPLGATPPEVPPRPGTLLTTRPVNGVATVYVAGTDGRLHGFATPEQFLDDGYDQAVVVTVPALTGLVVGSTAGAEGPAANALSTSADGAVVAASGSYFVFAGGHAFGIPTPAALVKVRRSDKARTLSGPVSSGERSAPVAPGVLVSTSGLVYVSYNAALWPFKSEAQLFADGYGGTAAIPVPATQGVGVVVSYTGS